MNLFLFAQLGYGYRLLAEILEVLVTCSTEGVDSQELIKAMPQFAQEFMNIPESEMPHNLELELLQQEFPGTEEELKVAEKIQWVDELNIPESELPHYPELEALPFQ